MKIIRNIFLAFGVLLLSSCLLESDNNPDESEIRGMMFIGILEKDGEAIDKIETARFLVFKNASGSPQLELNELFDIPAVSPGDNEVSKFEVLLEVSRKLSGVNDKLVVAIINEPLAMKNSLDQIYDYNELINIELNFADFLNNDHNSLQIGKRMPMTGIIKTNKVYATAQEAHSDPADMSIVRAVARVDVYARKQMGTDYDFGVGTNIVLRNTYDKKYFVRNQDGSNSFGKIQTITSGFLTKGWSATVASNIPDVSAENTGLFVCSFYTPERTCTAPNNADKLILDIAASSSQGEIRNGVLILDELYLNNVKTVINSIQRNNIYRVIVTVTENGLYITATVLDWNNEDIIIEF